MRWWMVRAGDQNELVPDWEEKNVVSIGWPELGDPTMFQSREMLLRKAEDVYSEAKPASCRAWASQLWRFSHNIKIGDRVLTYKKDKREYMVGTVTSVFRHSPEDVSEEYPNVLSVDWERRKVSRDLLSHKAKNSLGSTLTVFNVDDWKAEFEQLLQLNAPVKPEVDEETEEDVIIDDLVQKGITMIEDKVDKLDPWQMQDLVGGLLKAMGYIVNVSPKGPDGGVDILAHKDVFGFEKPVIKVQVKHRKDTAGAPEIRQLLGAHPIGENCLFVSTGGFSSSAKKEARQHNVKLLDLEQMVKMIVTWYEKMPDDTRSMLPLRKMYIPE